MYKEFGIKEEVISLAEKINKDLLPIFDEIDKNCELNSLKVLLKSAGIIVLAQLVLLGIMAITRMQIGELTIPFVLVVYVLSLLISTKKFDDDLEKIKVEAKK